MPTEFVRVRDKSTRHEYTIPGGAFREDAHELVTRKSAQATDSTGRPLPAKYYIPRATSAAPVAEGSTSATDNKESRE